MRLVFKILGGILAVLLLASAGLFLASRNPVPVLATVSDDASLPSDTILGRKLHLEVFGPEGAPLVIALHGGPGGDYRSLLPLRALSDSHRVLFYDQRGAGLSERVPASDLTVTGHVEELDAIATRYSPDAPVTLIGHSWGAMLASAYLSAHPARVSSAVLIEPGFLSAEEMADWSDRARLYMAGPSFWGKAVWAGFETAHVDGPDDSAGQDYFLGQMVHGFAAHPDNPYHCAQSSWTAPAWRFGASSSQTMQANVSDADFAAMEAGQDYTGPVLLMTGACDSWIGKPLQETRRFANSTLVDVPEAGHDVVNDQPAAALTAIRSFLAAQ